MIENGMVMSAELNTTGGVKSANQMVNNNSFTGRNRWGGDEQSGAKMRGNITVEPVP